MSDDQYLGAFYGNKRGMGSRYDFDLKSLIQDFSFSDLVISSRRNNEDNGAFLFVTQKQYIVGYNSGYGNGSHRAIKARIIKDITGGGSINSDIEASRINAQYSSHFIFARIAYECIGYNENGRPIYDGFIHIMPPPVVTRKMVDSFVRFCEDFKYDIARACAQSGNSISFTYVKQIPGKKSVVVKANSMEEICEYLNSIAIDNMLDDYDEIAIVGVSTSDTNGKSLQ